ncbi:MAG TPA: DNA mismatch repair endonuclease MutL [Candidatus Saccharimonadales bacterium]|nr:DNA mismatch repair endonuclease MutL [Candidatus Saccharimonadales bacterium]
MPKIKLLPPNIISKTAAGEVVERPASVVKELIENALDAGASQVQIEIENGGLDFIQVMDNGEGMDEFDILESFKHHTTSKVFNEEDLLRIASFGFRGEALSSVASVSKLTIQSRTASDILGNRVDIAGGVLVQMAPTGMHVGTMLTVRDLFYNTPARKKFLKTTQTEYRNILDVVVNVAMCFNEVGFTLINDDRAVLDLPRFQTQQERVRALLSEPISSQLLPFDYEINHFKVRGFVSKPQLSSINRSHQYIFVNNRFISNDVISSAAKDAYGSLLEPRAHPVLILFLQLPHELVDVNVHPRKEEVSFYDDSTIFDVIKSSVQKVLESNELTYTTDYLGNDLDADKRALPFLFNHLKENVNPWQTYQAEESSEILQIHKLYLVSQTKKGILLIDQHAAHERILFEQFLEVYEKMADNGDSLTLDTPLVFDLSVPDAELLEENFEILSKLGFAVEEFGVCTFKLSAIPKVLSGASGIDLINDVIADLQVGKKPSNINEKSIRTISYLSCRGAIKSGEYLAPQERKDLLEKLAKTKTNYTCPHGRPVKIEISMSDLEKMFKRVK